MNIEFLQYLISIQNLGQHNSQTSKLTRYDPLLALAVAHHNAILCGKKLTMSRSVFSFSCPAVLPTGWLSRMKSLGRFVTSFFSQSFEIIQPASIFIFLFLKLRLAHVLHPQPPLASMLHVVLHQIHFCVHACLFFLRKKGKLGDHIKCVPCSKQQRLGTRRWPRHGTWLAY